MIRIDTWSEKQFVIVMCAATLSLCVVSAENFSIHTLRSNLVLLRSHTELRSWPHYWPSEDCDLCKISTYVLRQMQGNMTQELVFKL